MPTTPIIESLSHALDHWQFLYILSITVALLSTFAMVVFAFHIQKHKTGLKISNYVYVLASVIAVVSTIVIVVKTKSLDAGKDAELTAYEKAADLKIADAQKQAADANKAAASANLENSQLQLQLGQHVVSEKKSEADLAAQNKQTSDFAHALAIQQGIMAEQAKVSPQLAPQQMDFLANQLKPFSGQDVSIHTTADTVVERLASSIATGLIHAGITTKEFSTDMGALYQGVSVAVHSPTDVPPLANALVGNLRQFGIEVRPVAAPNQVQAGKVAIFLGPN